MMWCWEYTRPEPRNANRLEIAPILLQCQLAQGQAWGQNRWPSPSRSDVGAAGARHCAGPSSLETLSHPHTDPMCDHAGVTPEGWACVIEQGKEPVLTSVPSASSPSSGGRPTGVCTSSETSHTWSNYTSCPEAETGTSVLRRPQRMADVHRSRRTRVWPAASLRCVYNLGNFLKLPVFFICKSGLSQPWGFWQPEWDDGCQVLSQCPMHRNGLSPPFHLTQSSPCEWDAVVVSLVHMRKPRLSKAKHLIQGTWPVSTKPHTRSAVPARQRKNKLHVRTMCDC